MKNLEHIIRDFEDRKKRNRRAYLNIRISSGRINHHPVAQLS